MALGIVRGLGSSYGVSDFPRAAGVGTAPELVEVLDLLWSVLASLPVAGFRSPRVRC